MVQARSAMNISLPDSLRNQLTAFQRRVWQVKSIEALATALSIWTVTYIVFFVSDRLADLSPSARWLFFFAGLTGWCVVVPWAFVRWIWALRRDRQLAQLLARHRPHLGDRLLGVIELVENPDDTNTSPVLRRAAIGQVADDAARVDFLESVPSPKHWKRTSFAGAALVLAVGLLAIPGAGWNSALRWHAPWADVARYTFTQLEPLAPHQVVAVGEPFELEVKLSEQTLWTPSRARARLAGQKTVQATRDGRVFRFRLPPQTDLSKVRLAIGDARPVIAVDPKSRPELTDMVAEIKLPEYLQHPTQKRDARSGMLSAVRGSIAKFSAKASRDLRNASVNGASENIRVTGPSIESNPFSIEGENAQELQWVDVDGLSAKTPFRLRLRAIDDRAPTLQCSNLSNDQVVLDEQAFAFEVAANDDFGVKRVGIEWEGIEDPRRNPTPQKGEYVLSGGNHTANALTAQGEFAPQRLGIAPQPIHLRAYAEDYMPGRERSYSPVYRLYVLNREQHMIWITQQLEQWERQALEVRDREQELLETNEQLAQLSPEELDKDSTRQQLARQASAEQANARRLGQLSQQGSELIEQATRNPEFNVNTLERWAQILKVLQQLSQKDMPSVASHLTAAANAAATPRSGAPSPPKPSGLSVQDSVRGTTQDPTDQPPATPPAASTPAGSPPPLGLPVTTLQGRAQPGGNPTPPPPANDAGQSTQQAVEEQRALLAEFNRVMGEMQQILQDLQGSTFVKRLKAAADAELALAAHLHSKIKDDFGVAADEIDDATRIDREHLQVKQIDTTNDVRLIQEDLLAYFERTKRSNYQQVYQEMKTTQVVANFKTLGDRLPQNMAGRVIADTEYWSDQLDRWAEMLVGPGCANCGKCPGGKGDNLPPSIVLEVLRILKAEVELRDSTRVAYQQQTAIPAHEYEAMADRLSEQQQTLHERIQRVQQELERLQTEQGKNYQKPLAQLEVARTAMQDAKQLLADGETGRPAIAAETEAIEALLITKKIKPGSGGGGGSTPGGGTGQGAADEAPALAGLGDDLMSEEREVRQATGNERNDIPDEYRSGLDAYFHAVEGYDGG